MSGSQIKELLSKIIDELVLENNPMVLDDDTPELLNDGEQRQEAVDKLAKMLEFYREDL